MAKQATQEVPPAVREWLSHNGKRGGALIKQAMAEYRAKHQGEQPKEPAKSK
ncbi:MAG TPA: hypothetical protein VGP72_16450 [Planctomycetota bacterium]|jgi:hypothetical protein